MEEIKVGEYIRDRAGNIAKVMKNHNTIFEIELNTGARINLFKEFIVKHSKNIIDLIEIGDYVNGKEVKRLKGEVALSDVNNEDDFCYTDYSDDYGEWYGFREDEIRTILTHEQFEQNSYKV